MNFIAELHLNASQIMLRTLVIENLDLGHLGHK